jgi:spermidine synthase
VLMSGTTVHGATRIAETGRPEPLTYYTVDGPLVTGIKAVRAVHGGSLAASVIGLGSGSLACSALPEERWAFFEIDPEVVAIATDRDAFRFLSDCAPEAPIILGDARLTVAESVARNDIIVIDAFSADSLPAHLITAEALRVYIEKLTADGAILVHISNRNLDLSRILARTAAEVGLTAYIFDDHSEEPRERRYRMRSIVMALARDPADLGSLATDWERLEPEMWRRPWTDDFSNILEAILDKSR